MCCIVKCCNCHILLAVDMAGVACYELVCVCVCVCVCERERGWKNGKRYRDDNPSGYCGIIPTLFGCFLGIPSLYVFKCFLLLVSVVFWGEEKGMNGV